MQLLQIEHVSFSYDQIHFVLEDINLSFDRGKVYGIIGKSGAGKTTLLSLIAGLEKIKLGTILYQGKNLMKLNRDWYRSHAIGIIFQSYNLLPQLTALENVILSMDIGGEKRMDKEDYALKLLNRVGISSAQAKRRVLHLSGGEQQRVSIARALSYHPDIILADEPTGNLDKETEQEIIQLLKDIAYQENKCVIIISHSQKVKDNVDIIHQIDKGKIV